MRSTKYYTSCQMLLQFKFNAITIECLSMMMCAACHENQYRCNNGECISACKRCDGRRQCADGSDETYCSKILSCVHDRPYINMFKPSAQVQ